MKLDEVYFCPSLAAAHVGQMQGRVVDLYYPAWLSSGEQQKTFWAIFTNSNMPLH